MSPKTKDLTKYFHDIQTRANLESHRFSSNSSCCAVDYEEVRSGTLSPQHTEELFHIGRNSKDKNDSLDVIVSIATLEIASNISGVGLIAASLDREGQLTCDIQSQIPWIPAELLIAPGTVKREVMVGKLADFWKWRLHEGVELASRTEDWNGVVDYAEAMIKAVCNKDQIDASLKQNAQEKFWRPGIAGHCCWIEPCKHICANAGVLELYQFLINSRDYPQAYQRLCGPSQPQRNEDDIDQDVDVLLDSALRAVGSMSAKFPLTDSQRRAVHAFLHDGYGDVTAVSGPPGTGKTTMLQAVVASLIVQHCLDKKPAPLIVGTSTNNQAVTNIIDSMSSVSKTEAGPLACRWLPVAAGQDGPTTEDGLVTEDVSNKPLQGLAVYTPSNAKQKEAAAKGYLLEDLRKSGVYSQYSEQHYVQRAKEYFLERYQAYARQVEVEWQLPLASVEQKLAGLVTQVDKARRQLLRLRHRMDKKRWHLWKRRSDTAVELKKNRKARKLIASLSRLCLLTEEQTAQLAGARNLRELDKVVDTTVRYAEFWLAVHRYEAQWLLICERKAIIPADQRWRTSAEFMERYWRQVAALTPCFVMTAYQLPKYFKLWVPLGEKPRFDLERADLLIVDEAGQVDTSLGACALAVAKRALIVGDVQQLAPIWGIDPDSDAKVGASFGLESHWQWLMQRGLTASNHSSLMQAAATASNWCFSSKAEPGLFLAEHFRCRSEIIEYCNQLVYQGRLHACRPKQGYALEGQVASPLMFHQVPPCEDRRQGSSRVNQVEAEEIARWIAKHYQQYCRLYDVLGNPEKEKQVFGVVTPFAAQARIIRSALNRELGAERSKYVTVGTAHALQGAERNVVLFSSVYGQNSNESRFINSTRELMNVAVSRAKDLFLIFGTENRWKDQGVVFKLVRELAVREHSPKRLREPPREPLRKALSEPLRRPLSEPLSGTAGGTEKAQVVQSASAGTAQPTRTVTASPVNVRMTNPASTGVAILASKMVKTWMENGTLPRFTGLQVKDLNQALMKAGLLQKVEDGWIATDKGRELGIIEYRGKSRGKAYRNVKYSPAAQDALAGMISTGQICPG